MDWRKSLFAVLLSVLSVSMGFALTISGDIDGEDEDLTTWGDQAGEDLVYITPNGATEIHVADGVELIIYPGVEVRFTGDYSLIIDAGATLTAEGSEGSEILFTGSTQSAGFWRSIKVYGEEGTPANASFDHCIVEYGGITTDDNNASGAVVAWGFSVVSIENSTVRYCEGGAFVSRHQPHYNDISVVNCTMYDCDYGIYIADQFPVEPNPDIIGNTIFGIAHDGIYTDGVDENEEMEPIIKNNLIFNCGDNGLNLAYLSVIENNTIAHCGESAIVASNALGSYSVKNNLLYDYTDYGLDAGVLTPTISYNCYYSSEGGSDTTSASVDADYGVLTEPCLALENETADTSTDVFDYHLLWDSPCLHAGENLSTNKNPNNTRCDIGAFGGPDVPIADYYVAIKGTLDDETTLLGTIGSPIRVIDDVLVEDGDSVYIGTTLGSFQFEFLEDVTWTIEGELVVDGYSSSNKIIFTAVDPSEPWDCISFEDNAEGDFEYFAISGADYGVYFSDNAIADLSHGEISDITLDGIVIATSQDYNFDYLTIEDCGANGIEVTNGDLTIEYSVITVDHSPFYLSSADATIDTCLMRSSDKWGIYATNSGPIITRSLIDSCGYNGFYGTASSDAVFGIQDVSAFGNRLYNNGMDAPDSGAAAEVYLYNSSPTIKNGYNDIVDTRTSNHNKLLLWTNDASGPVNYGYSYFSGPYGPDSVKAWSVPRGYFTFEAPGPYRGALTVTNMDLALEAEFDGEYEDAVDLYWNAFTEDGEPGALKRWICCNRKLEADPADLLDEVNELGELEGLERPLFWNRILLQNRAGEFEESIDMLDDFVDEAATELDSVQGMLSQLETYYQMALANGGGIMTQSAGESVKRDFQPYGLAQLGTHASIVPDNYADYRAKRDALMEASSRPVRLSDTGLPQEFALEAAYPNPFNPAVTIPFALPRSARVKIAVFNMLGQRVETLADRQLNAGRHSVTWDGSAFASGVYFVRMEAPGAVQTRRIVLMK